MHAAVFALFFSAPQLDGRHDRSCGRSTTQTAAIDSRLNSSISQEYEIHSFGVTWTDRYAAKLSYPLTM